MEGNNVKLLFFFNTLKEQQSMDNHFWSLFKWILEVLLLAFSDILSWSEERNLSSQMRASILATVYTNIVHTKEGERTSVYHWPQVVACICSSCQCDLSPCSFYLDACIVYEMYSFTLNLLDLSERFCIWIVQIFNFSCKKSTSSCCTGREAFYVHQVLRVYFAFFFVILFHLVTIKLPIFVLFTGGAVVTCSRMV